ncbi:dihydroxy-acid dehydratase [Jiangella endophytica]|uniref:dihydroxy-acid dehydratase n=1 Tax=Jiangella endophytica TaxID=1623398 RepID=UPI0018E5522D
MPEVGNSPIPKKLLAQEVRDVVRISGGRMSGAAFGTVVLHVEDDELDRRRSDRSPPPAMAQRGYRRLFADHVEQAPDGCDFVVLRGRTPIDTASQVKFLHWNADSNGAAPGPLRQPFARAGAEESTKSVEWRRAPCSRVTARSTAARCPPHGRSGGCNRGLGR